MYKIHSLYNNYKPKEKKSIPYWSNKKFKDKLNESSKKRNISRISFGYNKIKIFLLTWLAYYCPYNNLRILFNRWKGVNIGKDVFIGPACIFELAYPEFIYIEDNVSIAGSVIVLAHQNPYHHFKDTLESFVAPTIIGKGTFLAVRTTILPGAQIGEYSIITAGTVISRKTENRIIIGGNPARKIGNVKI